MKRTKKKIVFFVVLLLVILMLTTLVFITRLKNVSGTKEEKTNQETVNLPFVPAD